MNSAAAIHRPDGIATDFTWKRSRASGFSVISDGSAYFRAAKEAMLQARNTIFLIGWDFDARISLEPDRQILPGPDTIGAFLNWLVERTPGLEIRLLKWDLGILRSLGRGGTPLFLLDWLGHKNVRLRLDSAHAPGAAHHMKLLVVDDALAFCGGIDMTVGRWDTPSHSERDKNRRSPWGRHLPPWHDVTTCITGDAAKQLGQLARERWQRATGESIPYDAPRTLQWPTLIKRQFVDVELAISRTSAAFADHPQVEEIQGVTLSLIESAKEFIYIENQYLASRKIAYAIADRLKDPEGPEVVLVMPETADGWLEAKAMDSARSRLLTFLRKADVHSRFRAYYPVNASGTSVYVHAKVLIVDNRYLKVGSANLNNRSMGFDTECDVTLDATVETQPVGTSETIADCLADLLAEHLAVPQTEPAELLSRGNLIHAVDVLNIEGKLRPVVARPLEPDEELIAETDLVDPERPANLPPYMANPLSFFAQGKS